MTDDDRFVCDAIITMLDPPDEDIAEAAIIIEAVGRVVADRDAALDLLRRIEEHDPTDDRYAPRMWARAFLARVDSGKELK